MGKLRPWSGVSGVFKASTIGALNWNQLLEGRTSISVAKGGTVRHRL
jgi:hypothetical protein